MTSFLLFFYQSGLSFLVKYSIDIWLYMLCIVSILIYIYQVYTWGNSNMRSARSTQLNISNEKFIVYRTLKHI